MKEIEPENYFQDLDEIFENIRNLRIQIKKKEHELVDQYRLKEVSDIQLNFLKNLWMEEDDEIPLSYLTNKIKISKLTINSILETMEKNNLITRISDLKEQQRNTYRIKLTEKAKDLKNYKPPIESYIRSFEIFTIEEIKNLKQLLGRLSASFD